MVASQHTNEGSSTIKVKLRFITLLLITLFVLPIMYDYYKFLPPACSYLTDILLVVYLIRYPGILKLRNTFSIIYTIFIFGILLISTLSLLVHAEGIEYLLQEFRRLLYPLLFYLILTDIFRSSENTSVKLHKVFLFIFIIQIPVTIFQILSFHKFKSMGFFSKSLLPFVDAGAGTLGAAGHIYLGILIPLFILYLYDIGRIKYAIPFIIPILLTNSGGGLILSIAVFLLLFLHSFTAGTFAYRVRSFAGMMLFATLFFVASNTGFFGEYVNRYIKSFIRYNTAFIQGGQETWGEGYNQIKIDRFNGYKFLSRKMDHHDYEHLVGLGFSFKDNNNHRPYRYKNELNYFIAERGFLGLFFYFLFILIFIGYLIGKLHQNGYQMFFVKIVFFISFFISGLYNPNTRSFQVWILFVFVLALYENKHQYYALKRYLGEKVPVLKNSMTSLKY